MPVIGPIRRAGALGRRLIPVLGLAALAVSACSLAGDVTPPPGSGSLFTPVPSGSPAPTAIPPTSASNTSQFFPAALPAAQEGGLLFIQHCAPCHGDKGAGGGSLATQLPKPVPDFSNPATLRERTPQQLFATITQGRQAALMPPFANTLTDAQRWSLVSFLYTLSTPAERLTAGKAIYTANCARCHGQSGQGDGPEAAKQSQPVANFTDQSFMVTHSQQDFFKVVSRGDAAHPFTNLTDDNRWAALDAVRAFAYVYTSPDQLTAERPGSVTGKVVNQSAGGSLPAGLAVTLHSFDGQTLLGTFTTTASAEGSFEFAGIPFTPARQFLATTVFQSVTYASQVATFDASRATLSVLLPIYETTVDPAGLSVDQVHMFLEFTTPDQVTVGQLFIFSNKGDRTYASSAANPLRFNLPAGASALNVQDAVANQTYFQTADGFSLISSVAPGQAAGQVLFSFKLPYTQNLKYEQTMYYPVSNVDLLVGDLGLKLSGPSLQNLGLQNVQGQAFQNFSGGSVQPGATFSVAITGQAGTGATAPNGLLNSNTATLAIGAGALALALLSIGIWTYRRPARRAESAETKEDLLRAIAELDDAHAAGDVEAAAYERQRRELKAELMKVWD